MTTYLRLPYAQLLPNVLHGNATGNVGQQETIGFRYDQAPARTKRHANLTL